MESLRKLEDLLRGLRLEAEKDLMPRMAFQKALEAVISAWARENKVRIADHAVFSEIGPHGIADVDLFVLEDNGLAYDVYIKHGYNGKAYQVWDVKIVRN